MVKTAEADIISPAVAAEDPYGLLCEHIRICNNLSCACAGFAFTAVHYCVRASGDELLACFRGSVRVNIFKPFRACRLDIGVAVFNGDKRLYNVCKVCATMFNGCKHTETVLCVIFKEGVCPCRAVTALIVYRVRR